MRRAPSEMVTVQGFHRFLYSIRAVAAVALAGCASAPEAIPQVESVRTAVSAAAAAGQCSECDAAAHFGHLVEQTAKPAVQRSRAAEADARVAATQGERGKVLRQAREGEIGRARQSAAAFCSPPAAPN